MKAGGLHLLETEVWTTIGIVLYPNRKWFCGRSNKLLINHEKISMNNPMSNPSPKPQRRRLRIIWRTRRWKTKIIFARRGPNGEMFAPPPSDNAAVKPATDYHN